MKHKIPCEKCKNQSDGNNCLGEKHTNTEELKKEVIKHLKKLNTDELGDTRIIISKGNGLDVEDWIKHFFNITDEDLK